MLKMKVNNFSEAEILDNISSEDDTDDTQKEEKSLVEDIASWMTTHQIKHNAADDLLKLDQAWINRLALQCTDITRNSKKCASGDEIWPGVYLGVGELLIKNLDKYPSETKEKIERVAISLNIDGIPLFKSSKMALWTVLCAIHLQPVIVFPVALTCGT